MLDDPDRPVAVATSEMNGGPYPMSHGLPRMSARFYGDPERAERILSDPRRYEPGEAEEFGLVTVVADDIDSHT